MPLSWKKVLNIKLMNPNNPRLAPSSRNSQARFRLLPFTASRVGKLAACLILGVAALSQSARSQPPSYAASALSNKPVAFWQLNEANGATQAKDSSPNGLNGTYGVDAVLGVFFAPYTPYLGFAINQTALLCTAGDLTSVATIPPLNLNTNAVTIAMWINPTAEVSTGFTGLLMTRTSGGDAAGFGFGGSSNSLGMVELGYTWNTNNAATYNFNSGLYPLVAQWQFVALVVQSNSATIYLYYVDYSGNTQLQSAVNPIAHGPEAFSFSDGVNGLILLGSDVNGTTVAAANNVFPGEISDAAVYKSALSSDQILALFAAGVGVEGFAPEITGQPQSEYVVSGAPAHLTATGINGTTNISFQWQLNGTNVNALADSANFTGATSSNVLTILSATLADAGTYQLILTNTYGTNYSSNAVLVIQAPALVGEWLTNGILADVSGYSPAGTHDGYDIVGNGAFLFTNDVPVGKAGQSIWFTNLTGIAISNSSTLDGTTYTNTFDNVINNAFTVSCWGKGLPGSWNPFVSKWGEGRPYSSPDGGFQLRTDGNGNDSCFTVRCEQRGTLLFGNAADAIDDMATTTVPTADGKWHFYAGTYDAGTGIRSLWVDAILAAQESNNVLYDLAPYSHLCIGAKDSSPGNTFGQYTSNLLVYDVRIYNYALAQSNVLKLYGAVPAVINGQPPSAYPFAGQSATIGAVVGGTQPITYQWTLNGTPVNLLPDAANFTGATNSNVLTIASASAADQGVYVLAITNAFGWAISSNAVLTLSVPSLVGEWFNGPAILNDVSGYSPTNTHDGFATGAQSYAFTTDVPAYRSGNSLSFGASSASGISISNSSTGYPGYTNTFDNQVYTYLTVSMWVKGTFAAYSSAGWPAFAVKNGESGGWQLRGDQWAAPGWTVRDNNAGTMFNGQNGGWDGNDDMSANAGFDGKWHLYTGTYNSLSGYRALYIDGQPTVYETGNKPYITATASHVTINGEDSGNGNYNFTTPAFEYYDLRIYNYELSAAQASDLYNILPPGTPAQIGIQPPASISTTCQGVTVQIRAASGGSPPVTNQWQFNGTNLVDGNYGGVIISGSSSNVLTIADVTTNYQGVYDLVATNAFGGQVSSNATLTIGVLPTAPAPPGTLVGAWLTGAATLADTSRYSPAGTHDAWQTAGSTSWTNDLPPMATPGGSSLYFTNAGLAISNSSTLDPGYTSTFDAAITNSMTVMCWAKGWPGTWNPWVSKYGENGAGWQLRVNASDTACWTIRGTGGNEDMGAPNSSDDGGWHSYVGTYDVPSGIRSLYIDGVLAVTQTGQGPYNESTPSQLMIGAKDSGGNKFGNYYTGEIYGVYIYDTALSAAQVNGVLITPPPPLPSFNGLPGITTGPSGPEFVLTWVGGRLLGATNVTGPWTPTGATSPYTNFMTNTHMFFQLVNP